MTDFDEIQRILELMDEHGLEEVELEDEARRVRLRKPAGDLRVLPSGTGVGTPAPAAAEPVVPAAPEPSPDDGLVIVKSPIVGTFYRAPGPDAEPFVDVGSTVAKGQALCIIEAMKLMNEIDAEASGEIASIFVENGQPVQYGEKLFTIKPA